MNTSIKIIPIQKSGKPKKVRRCLFVDGSNLYAGQYELFGPEQYLHFPSFLRSLEETLQLHFQKIYYYTSFTRRKKVMTKKMKMYTTVESYFHKMAMITPKVIFFKGYRSKTSGKEKEVDVKLAVDMVDLAHLDQFDELYLLSADADYMHAIAVVKRLKKKVKIVAIENRIPYRFSYLFRTIVVVIAGNVSFTAKQKIASIQLDKNTVLKKIPGMQAYRAR